jgi:hypothetical protein
MIVGNRKAVQHPVIGVGGEDGEGFGCIYFASPSNFQSRRLYTPGRGRTWRDGANYPVCYLFLPGTPMADFACVGKNAAGAATGFFGCLASWLRGYLVADI